MRGEAGSAQRRRQVALLREGRGDRRDDLVGVEEELHEVEAQHRVAEQHEARVGTEVASTIGTLMVREAVELHDQPLPG